VIVRFQNIEIPKHLLRGDYEGDNNFRVAFQLWIQQLWHEKDLQIQLLRKESGVS
jgi:hypothetical protein